jgi:hypothetical protein
MKIHPVFHVSQLEPHQIDPIPGRVQEKPPPIEVEGEIEYEVNKVLDSRWITDNDGKTPLFQYRVSWIGYSASENSWEPPAFLANAQEKIQEFHTKYPQKPSPQQPPVPKSPRRSTRRLRGGE